MLVPKQSNSSGIKCHALHVYPALKDTGAGRGAVLVRVGREYGTL